jgi:hypothetical protein
MYAKCGDINQALEMKTLGIVPSELTYSIILSAFAEMTSLHEGQQIHKQLKVYKEMTD